MRSTAPLRSHQTTHTTRVTAATAITAIDTKNIETPLDPDIVTHAMKVERTAAAQGNEPQAYTPATELKSLKPWTMLALAALLAVIISLWTWHWQMAMTAILLVSLLSLIHI